MTSQGWYTSRGKKRGGRREGARCRPAFPLRSDYADRDTAMVRARRADRLPKEQVPAMLQTLLAGRFGMTVHRETKEQSVYALVVGKDGPKLKKSDAGAAASGVPA
jgi:uncharacterized protein (TIGR03435 family)